MININEWHPIDSAPMNGTMVLLGRVGDKYVHMGRYDSYTWTHDDGLPFPHRAGPTHWRPLPAPPDAPPTDRDAAGGASGASGMDDEDLLEWLQPKLRAVLEGPIGNKGARLELQAILYRLSRRLNPAPDHQSATDVLRQIATLRHSLPRHSVTQDNAVEAYSRLNRHIIGIFDLADAALAGGHQDRTAPTVGEDERIAARSAIDVVDHRSTTSMDDLTAKIASAALEAAAEVRAARAIPPASAGTEAGR